jgi:arylsulfatase A-like enzyme
MQAEGFLENTIVVITADHGEGLGDHGSFAHELYLYDFLVRVPLIIYYPEAIPGGQQWRRQVSLADIVPTTLGLSGIPVPEDMDGRDLSRWLVSGTRPDDSRLLTGTYRWRGYDRYMVRSDRYKLIYDIKDEREEFYDLVADPTESSNLIGAQLPVDEYETLRAELDQLITRHEAIDPERVDKPANAELMEKLRSLGYIRVKEPQQPE